MHASPPNLIDSHCHLDVAEFDHDREAVLARARAAGVAAQIVPAVTAQSWVALAALCDSHHDLHPAYGLHPTFLADHRPEHLVELGDWLATHRACALGECGLDFHVEGLERETQQRYFAAQLALARDFDLPLILHARRAVEDVTRALRRVGGLRGVVHSFSGSEEQARQLWELGFHLGIGGPVTYARARRLRRIVATMPIEWLLLETDAPDQPLCGHQGARNEPGRLREIANCIAQLRGVEVETVAQATTSNARTLFALGNLSEH